MKKFLFKLVICLFPLFLHSNLNIDQLSKQTDGIVVEVIAADKKGWFDTSAQEEWIIQGFFLNDEGYILTCKKFLENRENYRIRWKDAKQYCYEENATLVAHHPTEDLAIMKINPSLGNKFPSSSILYEPVMLNSYVFISHTRLQINENYPVIGKIINTSRSGYVYEAMIAIPAYIGGRGAPVFNTDGMIIGVQTGSYVKGKFICCISLISLKEWIENVIGH